MQLTDFNIQNVFKRAAAATALTGSQLLTGCATNIIPQPGSCIGGGGLSLMGFGFNSSGFDEKCGAYQKDKLRMEADVARAETLMKTKNDPVSNALGVLLSLDLNPEAKKKLEARMGGADKVRVEPETLTGLLTSDNMQSRYVGLQLYARTDEATQGQVNQQLKEQNVDISTLIPASSRTANETTTITSTNCTRTRKGNQVVLDCPK